MKSIRFLCLFMLFNVGSFSAFSQIKDDGNNDVLKKFSVEINADTSLDELIEIEKMLQEKHETFVRFEDVKIENKKIVSLRMKLSNKHQSYMKSIYNSNLPIDTFKIIIDKKSQQNWVTIDNENRSISLDKNLLFNSFSKPFPEIESNFGDIEAQFDKMMQQLKESSKRFEEIYNQLENEPKEKKETITNKGGSTTTTISKQG